MEIAELYKIFQTHPVITTDSRECPKGSIFFALRGETFNGNEYAKAALEKGCAFAVIDQPEYADMADSSFVLVDDVLKALQQLANYHRNSLGTRIVGITGTNGKTTTKELVAAVLSRKYKTLSTQGHFNNHIGVPKTQLRLTAEQEVAVIEMGANHPGEIHELVNIVEPDYGLITNVGKAHLLGFGSFEGVIRTKGELYDYMRGVGHPVFINNDNPHLIEISDGLQLIRYGQEYADNLTVRGRLIETTPFLRFSWTVEGKNYDVQTQLIGSYNLDNALSAIAVGLQFGVAPSEISVALEEYVPSNNRSQLKRTADNTLIIDAYNANPTSMAAALENFRLMKADNKLCILGDMKELGESSGEEHKKILELLSDCEFKNVWLVGEEFRKCVDDMALPFHTFADIKELNNYISTHRPYNSTILIKGSNSTRLIDCVSYL